MSTRKHLFPLRAVAIALIAAVWVTGLLTAKVTAKAVENRSAAISETGIEAEIEDLLEEISAERRWAIEQHFESILTWLQEASEAAMRKKDTSLAALAECERQLKKAVYERKAPVSEGGSWGLLASILYSARVSSVVIDGQILHEGETIHGVKVVRINEDTVELAKDGQMWRQKVGMTFPIEADPV
jgi:hypothetical protein